MAPASLSTAFSLLLLVQVGQTCATRQLDGNESGHWHPHHKPPPGLHAAAQAASVVSASEDETLEAFIAKTAQAFDAHQLPVRAIHWVFDQNALLTRPHPDCYGTWLEFGVFVGGTINITADYRLRNCGEGLPPVYGFDTFTGLPEDWNHVAGEFRKGAFSLGGHLPPVRPNVHLIKGLFSESLPPFLEEHYGGQHAHPDITYLHIDCDLYQGTIEALTLLDRHIAPGCILLFDELFNYPGYRDGEIKALWEWLKATGRSLQVIGMLGPLEGSDKAINFIPESDLGWHHQSVAFRVLPGDAQDVA